MKDLILNNWMAKIMSLLLALTLWFLIKKNVESVPRPELPRVVLVPETPKNEEPQAKPQPTEKPVKNATPADSQKPKSKVKNR